MTKSQERMEQQLPKTQSQAGDDYVKLVEHRFEVLDSSLVYKRTQLFQPVLSGLFDTKTHFWICIIQFCINGFLFLLLREKSSIIDSFFPN